MFKKVLIANRGEIACRIQRSLKRMGIASVAVYSEADRFAPNVLEADEAVCIGPAPAAQSYLDIEVVVRACKETGAEAVHPGYGFLSESTAFVKALDEAGICFIGPAVPHIEAFGEKHIAREIAEKAGVPLVPGSPVLENEDEAAAWAARTGYPVMLKASGGGGGIGMRLCETEEETRANFAAVKRLGAANFKNDAVFLEKFVREARHVEVQVFGDGKGKVIALGERDCSLQRRNQKVIEETPAPNLPSALRDDMLRAAIDLCASVSYASAGTVEFIYDAAEERFYFLEVNTRLQVEHGVTELVTGVDLVEWMVKQAVGEMPPLESIAIAPKGAAMEARIYAEDPAKDFRPSSGLLADVFFPEDVRVDGWVSNGTEVTPFYDPLLAKVLVYGETRDEAAAKLKKALGKTRLGGLETNLAYLEKLAGDPVFTTGDVRTSALNSFHPELPTIDVVEPGALSTLQDYPGRIGYWHVGVPPSGPMDDLSFRWANRLVGNGNEAAALELTMTGPTLQFHKETVIALTGAAMDASLDGKPVPYWEAVRVSAGATLTLGAISGAGQRTYLAVRHGFEAAAFLGSASTFTLGGFGGHAGRALKAGDVLHMKEEGAARAPLNAPLAEGLRPELTREWEIGVLYGPHGAPDFFDDDDISALFIASYEVHFNSARTGVRLIGPKPKWARPDGGEAGLHPSNIHDNAYAVGTLDFTGDMPILLGPDGPSLGGFVCPVTVAEAERWKLGQLKPGDKLRFVPVAYEDARRMREAQTAALEAEAPGVRDAPRAAPPAREPAVLAGFTSKGVDIAIRRAGDRYLLVEYGPIVLDLALRFRVQVLMQALEEKAALGILEMTPGIRSLQIHYEPALLPEKALIALVQETEDSLSDISEMSVPSRIVRMPLAWNDPRAQEAALKYQKLVRPNAPWCPDNIEFIRRINGLDSIEDVYGTVFKARYLVMGLGDVYLGAPVATPLDPRHRLVTTKYNPARTWTPQNAVGIGGAYMCIYGMEGPGGYQLFGRTLQVWNTFRHDADGAYNFEPGVPWLLRFFDQIEFFPVSTEELDDWRADFLYGKRPVEITETEFHLGDYTRFLKENEAEIAAFRAHQKTAFEEERESWKRNGLDTFDSEAAPIAFRELDEELPEAARRIEAGVTGSVWSIDVAPGESVTKGQTLLRLEAMKMEIEVKATHDGVVHDIFCVSGDVIQQGDLLAALLPGEAA
ncbi:urea carboxylase [Tepidicaulis sp. LMO-SS28]|uniref:urea carboxylase n=1 Tax=Tepidicaulis sp. LMO-SS28 TaxID=3447455 RepID=UPI003EE0E826